MSMNLTFCIIVSNNLCSNSNNGQRMLLGVYLLLMFTNNHSRSQDKIIVPLILKVISKIQLQVKYRNIQYHLFMLVKIIGGRKIRFWCQPLKLLLISV